MEAGAIFTCLLQKIIAAGVHKPAQIADGVEPADGLIAGSAVFLARHGRHMVDANRRGAVHVPIAADGARHVGLPVVVEGLVEARLRA